MSVKMSDVFDLPMQQGDHQRFLLDSNDVYICETEYNNQSEAAKIAINTYDANQEEINNLHGGISIFQQENIELIKKVKHWKSNHGNLVIKLRVFTSRPDLTINKQQEEIKALNAHIESVRSAFENYEDHVVFEILNKTPKQCLADVRADAVDEFIKLVTSKHGNALTQPRLRACAKQLRGNANASQ